MKIEKACKGCGTVIAVMPSQNWRVYCSQDCKRTTTNLVKICETCGELFTCQRNAVERRHHCSKLCYDAAQTKLGKRFCQVCGDGFAVHGKSSRVYCSIACSIKGRSEKRRRFVWLKCAECGLLFERPRYWKTHSRTFCSKRCYGLTLARENQGHAHNRRRLPLFSDERGPNWRTQVKHAKRRDNYTCQRCGATTTLEVHHIRPFRLFGGDYKAANTMANLTTLCKSCHSLVERTIRV